MHPIREYYVSSVEKYIGAAGLFLENSDGRFHVFHRWFRPASLHSRSPVLGMYIDLLDGENLDQEAKELLEGLQDDLTALHASSINKYEIDFRDGIDLNDSEHSKYMESFLDDACDVILSSLDQTERCLALQPDRLVEEAQLHLAFLKERASKFSPTTASKAVVDRVLNFLHGQGGKAFVLHGPSGAGKTYAVSKIVADFSQRSPGVKIIVRFLGTSADTGDVYSLLRSVCQQLHALSNGEKNFIAGTVDSQAAAAGLGPCPLGYDDLVKYFNDAVKRWSWGPLVLVFESLDQLNDTNSGRQLAWLPVDDFSLEVHVLCSTLPDEEVPEIGKPFRCLTILQKRLGESSHHFVRVEPLRDAELLLRHLLALKGRKVTPDQMCALVKVMERVDSNAQTPLMATLLAELARRWKSTSQIPPALPSTVREIIIQFFEGLVSFFEMLEKSKGAGKRLVMHTLAYITLVKAGITDSELLEVLSLDDYALADSHLWWVTPELRLPSAPLALLLSHLAPYLSQRRQEGGGSLLFWYHRQLWEAAEAHYLKDQEFLAASLQILSEFFSGKFAGGCKPCNDYLQVRLAISDDRARQGYSRYVREQPLSLNRNCVFHPNALINDRRGCEALHHMIKALEVHHDLGKKGPHRKSAIVCAKMAEEELCSVASVCARSRVGETYNLILQSSKLLQLSPAEHIQVVMVEHFKRWMLRDGNDFSSPGGVVASVLRQPAVSMARQEHERTRDHVAGIPWKVLGGAMDFDPIVSILKGHERAVNCVAWSPVEGSQMIASASDDNTIIISDVSTGAKVSVLKGHTAEVKCVMWSPNGSQLASGSNDKTVIIWDSISGGQLSKLEGHTRPVMSVAWSSVHGSHLVSGSLDKTAIVWDISSNEKVSELKGHTGGVNSVAWSPSGAQVVSGSADKTAMMWDASTGNRASTLAGHTDQVLSVAWKGDLIATGSADKTAIVWSTEGEVQKELTLQGHTDWVRGVALSNDGAQVATCSDDKTAVVWDSSSGSQISRLEGHTDFVNSVAWSPGNMLVGTASKDKTAAVWDAGSGQQVFMLQGHSGAGAEREAETCIEDRAVGMWVGAGGGGSAEAGGNPAAGSGLAALPADVAGEASRPTEHSTIQNFDGSCRCCRMS